MVTYIILLVSSMILEYINENKIYNIHLIYHYIMNLYFSLFFIGLGWLYLNKNITYCFNSLSDFVYTNIYDYFFGNIEFKLSTPNLFYYSIKKIEPNSRVLDFGCGNGICYSNQLVKDIIIKNNIKIQGIDIDKVYINKCLQRIKRENLDSNVNIHIQDVFTFKLEDKDKFDYIILSESAPLLNEKLLKNIVQHMLKYLLKKNGKIIFINNLTENYTPTMEKLKPLLKYISMIDFGRILTKKEFKELSKELKLDVEFNLIAKMKIRSILNYFNLGWTYYFWRMIGIQNYEVEQYEIKFF